MLFLRCVGEALAAKGLRGLMGLVPFGEILYDFTDDVIARYRKASGADNIAAALEGVLAADPAETREQARLAAQAAGVSPEEAARIEAYLNQIPGVARQSLRREQDPQGRTVPPAVNLNDPTQLANVLPRRAPRFRAGDPVPNAPQWRFVELLGSGGFGEVWLTRHSFLGQTRAVKFCLDPASRDRLLRHEGEVVKLVMEVSAGERADQHGIVALLDACLEGDTPWLAYEYIDGGDLAGLARELRGAAPPERAARALQLLRDLAGVIGRFHRLPRPVIHRDLKPANVLLRRTAGGWVVRVTDFGISQVAAVGSLERATIAAPAAHLGDTFRGAHTPIYASPQQKRGLHADVRDDVHALGLIGYQLLLGDLAAERPAGKWRKRLADCRLPDAVLDVLESCWDDDPDERPRDAAALAEALASPQPPPSWDDVDADFRAYLEDRRMANSTKPWLEARLARAGRWQEAASGGHAGAMVLIGDCCAEGVGTQPDHAAAMWWFRSAADKGCHTACSLIGWLHRAGMGVPKDPAVGLTWYHKAAAAGDAWAMHVIGLIHEKGQGVPASPAEGRAWYRKAAEAGHFGAMFRLGTAYDDGVGVSQDHAEAFKWYSLAAAGGHADAMNNLGMLLDGGLGVRQDHVQAMAWFQKAAAAGCVTALNNVGMLYRNGEGVPRDYTQAMSWFQKAAALGDLDAMCNIAALYKGGRGVPQSRAQAVAWYRKAAEAGSEEAKARLAELGEA